MDDIGITINQGQDCQATKLTAIMDCKTYVEFTINGVLHRVSGNIPVNTSLNDYIRDYAKLRGTKVMCREGGCGACIVAAEINGQTMAVNSCLIPVVICNCWAIHTIEGIGNKKDGYNKIQAALAEKNGTQCGYCSPGMVMNLYSLLKDKELTMLQIENSFGGNICRCTGYRPILEAFKGFAKDAPKSLKKDIRDIEDLYKIETCPEKGLPCCIKTCMHYCADKKLETDKMLDIKFEDAEFFKVYSIKDLLGIFRHKPDATYMLHGGNTANGVYRAPKCDIYIDVNDVADLRRIEKTNDSLTLGGNVSLTTAMETFEKYSTESGFYYLRHLARHIGLIANVPVRNMGSIAGNLMIKHEHNEFPSDLFLILETAGTQMHILDGRGSNYNVNNVQLYKFLKMNMNKKIVKCIKLQKLSDDCEFRSYKIMPRAQNAHAQVNAGFLFKFGGSGKILEKPNIIFGGINEHFLHAEITEQQLVGKTIFDKQVLKNALETLWKELQPDNALLNYSPKFRKTLALGLFYKFVLCLKPDNENGKIRSGGTILERGLSSGTQYYEVDKTTCPLGEPTIKLEAIYQTSGEAQYANDLPPFPGEVFCAFVLTNVATGKIENIDASKALKKKGVIAWFTAEDVPGKNLCINSESQELMLPQDELLFAEKDVMCAGQPVGVIVAETHNLANEAAKLVEIKYSEASKEKPLITIEDVINSKDETRITQTGEKTAQKKGTNTKHVLKDVFQCGGQYHFTMETQSCVCVPQEDGMDVYPTSQWIDLTQVSIAQCLNVKNNSINVNVKRIGGGYGAKISRNTQIACTCALVCYKLNRPARFVLSIESNMASLGMRGASRQEYEVGVDDNGVIQYLNCSIGEDKGLYGNESGSMFAMKYIGNCYPPDNWAIDAYEVKTDVPSNTFCRGPTSTEAIAMTEHIMEHIARVTKKDPIQVRLSNMVEEKSVLESMINDLCKSADYEMRKRAIDTFNNENRWKKKGIALVPLKYPIIYFAQYNVVVSICARDGTVCVTHGGIECGQGINTKVAQVVAYTLGIDLSLISVKPSNNLSTPNNVATAASVTSESSALAAIVACKELLNRLEPIKKDMKDATWQEHVFAAYMKDVDLCARHMAVPTKDIQEYEVYGVTIGEVELDLLTGQQIVTRVDLLEDAGISINPEVDIGQMEGAFVMGLGYWTSEDLIYDPKTGLLLNNRTWNYKPPGAKDIPVDFRVTFRKNSANTGGVLRSKATGEPSLCMACVIPIAIRYALNSARADSGNTDAWYQMDGPFTTERILMNSLTSKENMTL